ncbi:hypothetical protein, partial [Frankia sp. CpI1-P]
MTVTRGSPMTTAFDPIDLAGL